MKTNLRLVVLVTLVSLLTAANAMGVICTYQSADVPKAIPDRGTVIASLDVPDSFTILDVDVALTIMHPWDTDLDVYLVHNGVAVELFSDVGGSNANFINTVLDDEASKSIAAGSAPFTGSFRPENRVPEVTGCNPIPAKGGLAGFDGLDAKGLWQLVITDDELVMTGVLQAFSLMIDSGPASAVPANPIPADGAQDVPINSSLSWDVDTVSSDTIWDVYFGTDPNALQLVASDLTEPLYCPGELDNGVTYSWQVVSKRACAQTTGPVWSFRSFAFNIIYVTSVKDNDQDGIQDDQGWVDWLVAQHYDVDARPGYWKDPLDANDIAELEAADLIIASRGLATGDYDGAETPKWNALSTPTICTNAWMIRSNRWKWMNSTAANKDADSPLMLVLDPTHPIFMGVAIDADGLADVLDPTVGTGHTSFLNDILDVGNGTLLAQSLGIYNTAWIVEWPAGVEYYAGAVEIAGGKRMLLMAGTQDDPYTLPSGLIYPVGLLNLNAEGQKLLRNAVRYMLGIETVEIPIENYSFEDPNSKQKCWNGENLNTETPDDPNDYFTDVPGWSSDTAATDSGIEGPDAWPGHTDGVMTGFLRGTDPSAWNLTDYVIKAADDFILFVDARDNWTESASMPAKLQMTLYCLVDGVRTPLATKTVDLTTTWNTFSLTLLANDVPAAKGLKIGIELTNATATNQSWIGLDNVHLFDLSGNK